MTRMRQADNPAMLGLGLLGRQPGASPSQSLPLTGSVEHARQSAQERTRDGNSAHAQWVPTGYWWTGLFLRAPRRV
jgi:hypothetical protein